MGGCQGGVLWLLGAVGGFQGIAWSPECLNGCNVVVGV